MSKPFPHIIPQMKDWPIYRVSREKKQFKETLIEQTVELLIQKNEGKLKELLAQCAYSEKNRVKLNPWKVDPASEKSFWLNMSKKLTSGQDCIDQESCEILLKRIVSRYVSEIVGGFKLETFQFANKFLTYFFNRLFSSYFAGSILNVFGKKRMLYKKMHVAGYVEETRELFKKGTVILVPTHQSNLDSILLGFYIHLMVGLPAFSYGAGLNLYNFEILAHYMNRLGAYKVDRRKKNAIYHETLFNFLRLSVQSKVNNIFFPGGGRVRDGKIEQNLKMGLLSALIQAQKSNCRKGNNEKLFVIPVIFNNHFVLEAKALINDFLTKTGKEKFNRKKAKEGSKVLSTIPYIYNIISDRSEVVLSFGKPMDVMGNPVDKDGNSLGQKSEKVDLNDYFMINGVFTPDFQRESIYTKRLAANIADSYKKHAVILSSHIMAFVCYQYLLHTYRSADIFDLFGHKTEELIFDSTTIVEWVEKLRVHCIQRSEKGDFLISDDLYLEAPALMQTGIQKLGPYHLKKPLKIYSDNKIVCKELKLLYYYANRLSGFDFENILLGD